MQSLGEIREILELRLRAIGKARYLFRGQADAAWSLEPSIVRHVSRDIWTLEEAMEKEKLSSELFAPAAKPHLGELEREPRGLVEWWSVKQHYGVPTRTLDWSSDPWVALYFAAEHHPDRDGALWWVHPSSVQRFMRCRYGSKSPPHPPGPAYYCFPAAPEHLFFGDVLLESPRKRAQRGMFSWCRRLRSDHASVIARALDGVSDREDRFQKLIIPARLKPEVLESLAGIEITASSVWPDPESGLAKAAAQVKTALLAKQPAPRAD